MKLKIFIVCLITFLCSCSSDKVIVDEKVELFEIFRKIIKTNSLDKRNSEQALEIKKNRQWLKKFKQPIILISSLEQNNQATLVALGNNDQKLTWVSADGISLTFNDGILIATRGYSEDLIALREISASKLFASKNIGYKRTHRYLDGENRYSDITFNCEGTKLSSQTTMILNISLPTDRFIEKCKSLNYSFTNEYDLLAETDIVVKSKQWISPSNKSFLIYNLYAFQKI